MPRKKGSKRKYGKAAGKNVKSAMHRKTRDAAFGQGGKGREGDVPKTGNRHRPFQGAEERGQGAGAENRTLVPVTN